MATTTATNDNTPQPMDVDIVVPTHFQQIPCRTSDGALVTAPSYILRQSKTFKQMCANMGISDDGDQPPVHSFQGEFPVPNVTSATMRKVLDWCEHHQGRPDPVMRTNPMTMERIHFDMDDYETAFFQSLSGTGELVELIQASNYLDIPSLYSYSCQTAANSMRNKTAEEVRAEWGWEDDLTLAEKKKIHEDHVWASQPSI